MAYTYAGGFTEGVRRYFKVREVLENQKPYGQRTHEDNHPGIKIHADPWDAYEWGETDAVFANPPCAPFSPTGFRKDRGEGKHGQDPRLEDHKSVLVVGKETNADVVVLESVMNSLRHGRGFHRSLRDEILPDHDLHCVIHNAAHLGIAQNRPRIFWVYTRVGFTPAPFTSDPMVLGEFDLGKPGGGCGRKMHDAVKAILPHVPPGKPLRPYWDLGPGGVGKPSVCCKRLAWDQPAPTIAGTYGYVHPDENRYLTLNELKRLCGYPEDYAFAGSPTAQNLQMVRAVLPPVAEWIADAVADSLHQRPDPTGDHTWICTGEGRKVEGIGDV